MDTEIVKYLREKYSPQVIALAGSRALGMEKTGSDWDLFLFCEDKHSGGFFEWNGQLLDLTFHEWPKSDDWVFTIPYGPVWPVKVLFDDTHGVFDAILRRTKDVDDLGPLKAYPVACEERLHKLDRWLGKIHKHETEPEIQFYYAGYIYEFLIRIWFEKQNLWPQPPARAIQFIKEKDLAFWELLSTFTMVKGKELTLLTSQVVQHIKQLKKL